MNETTFLPGYFALEGLDGCGTTTQWNKFSEWALQNHKPWIFVREPTRNPIGLLLRSFLQGKESCTPATLAQLFAADRREQLFSPGTGTYSKTLERNLVLSDRCVLSSLAYQTLDLDWETVQLFNFGIPLPEKVIFLDIQPESGMKRVEHRGGTREIFEEVEKQRLVRENYLKAFQWAETRGSQVFALDAEKSPDEIFEGILSILTSIR